MLNFIKPCIYQVNYAKFMTRDVPSCRLASILLTNSRGLKVHSRFKSRYNTHRVIFRKKRVHKKVKSQTIFEKSKTKLKRNSNETETKLKRNSNETQTIQKRFQNDSLYSRAGGPISSV